MTAHAPTTTPVARIASGATTAAELTPDVWSGLAGSFAARANQRRGCSLSTIDLARGYEVEAPGWRTTTPAFPARAAAAAAGVSAKARSKALARSQEFTASTSHLGSPWASLPPSSSINSPKVIGLLHTQGNALRRVDGESGGVS